ncbi:MAG: 4-hydroxy-tetrahydrodipicolinate synthase [Spirochaetales bacterium]|jgi:4-hydroxy-tetrahydrodipicolinate synthase|nr:4-hydroxy-tetrahydrodipicolinate synthase [Spirochaetales bacterium]
MYQGVYTALITPFNKDGSVDREALKDLVEFQITEGISGLVPVGTTGESPTVSHDENVTVVQIVIEQAKKRVPVIAGTGSNSTAEAIAMTGRAKDVGADATLQVTPYYNKPSQEGIYRHFTAIADAVGLPMIIYNIAGRTAKNIENDTMLRLARHPKIVAVKEASGDLAQVMDLYRRKPADFDILSGDDNLGLPIIALGGTGIISVASNIIPGKMERLAKLCREGKMEEARALHYGLLPFFKTLFIETNPIPVKYAASLLGKCAEVYRLPMCGMTDDKKAAMRKVLQNMGLL